MPPLTVTVTFLLSNSGWGDTGSLATSTDKLQETVVYIVQSSICTERINQRHPHDSSLSAQSEGFNEDLIVCARGAGSGGPCKVNHKL